MEYAKEYWATFSIYDYQTPRYRRSLVLFDKVVIPVPTKPIKSVTQQEIDKLSAEVDYLESKGLALGVKWDRDEFEGWREGHAGEALAQLIDKDRQLATRLQLQEGVEKLLGGGNLAPPGKAVRAVPVYADWSEYDALWKDLPPAPVFDIVARKLAVPADDAPLEAIVELRDQPNFKESMSALRRWQDDVILDLLRAQENKELREGTLQKAVNDLEKWTGQYERAVEDARFRKVRTAVVSALAVAATLMAGAGPLIASLAALAPPLFDFREVTRPVWYSLSQTECAPVGVIYESAAALKA